MTQADKANEEREEIEKEADEFMKTMEIESTAINKLYKSIYIAGATAGNKRLRDQLSKERAEANYWANEQAKTLNALADRNAGLSSELSKSNCNYLLIVEQLEKDRETVEMLKKAMVKEPYTLVSRELEKEREMRKELVDALTFSSKIIDSLIAKATELDKK